jgi:hypothetical protein
MSDALRLPPRPNLEQYKKLAKDFQQACRARNSDAIRDCAASWAESIARLHGLEITPEVRRQIGWDTERIERTWIKGLVRADSPVSAFESAADAIVNGDMATLRKLLHDNTELVRARSTREHRSTLLHYVSANGVEDFRQKTPKNIIEIAKLVLGAGADVNAESDAYGGRSTTLGLTATSYHPEAAGVQLPLMDLLIEHGAIIDGPDGGSAVNGCLHNGRGKAAEFFARRGARLDLEGAAGVGRLAVVKGFFKDDGSLKPPATQQQMKDGFAWTCEFGRTSVVDFLLQKGMAVDTMLKHDGQTGLHWAAYGGHADTVQLLLEHGAPVDVRDENHGGTPLDWALYAWGNCSRREVAGRRYYEVVARLARAGAQLDPPWDEDNEDRRRAMKKIHSDPCMRAALAGKMASREAPSSARPVGSKRPE